MGKTPESTYPEPHEWVDKPNPATQQAIDEAMADLKVGRSVVFGSEPAFDALLADLSADPQPDES